MNSRRFLATICGTVLVLSACTNAAVPVEGTVPEATTLTASATTVTSADAAGEAGSTTTVASADAAGEAGSTTTIASADAAGETASTTTVASTDAAGETASTTTVASTDAAGEAGSTTTVASTDPVDDDPESLNASVVPLDLPAGTCFDDPPADVELVTPDDIPIVDCGSPHANEVFGNFDVGGEEFPGDSSIHLQADGLCYDTFEEYVGMAYESSRYDFSWYFPTAESWPIGGTNIICFAYNMDLTTVTGSIQNTGR